MRWEHLKTKEIYTNVGEVIFCHTEQYIDDAKDILSNTQNLKVRKRVTMKDIAEDYLKYSFLRKSCLHRIRIRILGKMIKIWWKLHLQTFGESKIGFVISDNMDSLPPKKIENQKSIIYYDNADGGLQKSCWNCR